MQTLTTYRMIETQTKIIELRARVKRNRSDLKAKARLIEQTDSLEAQITRRSYIDFKRPRKVVL